MDLEGSTHFLLAYWRKKRTLQAFAQRCLGPQRIALGGRGHDRPPALQWRRADMGVRPHPPVGRPQPRQVVFPAREVT